MTHQTQNNEHSEPNPMEQGPTEMDLLKQRARLMGIDFSPNIGLETLKKRVQDKLDGITEDEWASQADGPNALEQAAAKMNQEGAVAPAVKDRPMTLLEYQTAEQMRLIRCRITCMDPKKKDLQGEFFTVANEVLGTVRKFIPFGEATEEGYHIPFILYTMITERKFLNITSKRNRRTGTMETSTAWAKEFAVEVLEPLTKEELNNLAQAQIAAGSLDPAST